MGRLHEYFLNNSGRIIYKHANYFDVYEQHFGRFEGQDINFLEIGAGEGGSSSMWKDYFGPAANIIVLDIRKDRAEVVDGATKFFAGSQADPKVLQSIVDEFGPFDIVLDDGSHIMNHMIASFEFLYPTMHPHGVYMIEDVACAYHDRFDGGLRRGGTIIEYTKDLIDRLYAIDTWEHEKPIAPDEFTLSTQSINIYDGIITFERRPKAAPQSITTAGFPRFGERPVLPSTLDTYRNRKKENKEKEARIKRRRARAERSKSDPKSSG